MTDSAILAVGDGQEALFEENQIRDESTGEQKDGSGPLGVEQQAKGGGGVGNDEGVVKTKRNAWHVFLKQKQQEGITNMTTISKLYKKVSAVQKKRLNQQALQEAIEDPKTTEMAHEAHENLSTEPKRVVLEDKTLMFRCCSEECGRVFGMRCVANTHIQHCAFVSRRRVACALCSDSFSSQTNLRHHIARAHKAANKRQESKLKNANSVNSVDPLTFTGAMFFTSVPNLPSDTAGMLENPPECQQPANAATSLGGYVKCEECGRFLKSHVALKRHKLKAHESGVSSQVTNGAPFACNICGKRFPQRTRLKWHMTDEHNVNSAQKSTEVDVDESTSVLEMESVGHLAASGTFECLDCGERVKSIGAIRRHYKTSHDKNLPFNDLMELLVDSQEHPMSSMEDGDNKVGSTKDDNVKPICGYCLKVFSSVVNLSKHLERMHKDKMPPGTEPRFVTKSDKLKRKKMASKSNCILCAKKFLTRIALLNHYHHFHRVRGTSVNRVEEVSDSLKQLQSYIPNKSQEPSVPTAETSFAQTGSGADSSTLPRGPATYVDHDEVHPGNPNLFENNSESRHNMEVSVNATYSPGLFLKQPSFPSESRILNCAETILDSNALNVGNEVEIEAEPSLGESMQVEASKNAPERYQKFVTGFGVTGSEFSSSSFSASSNDLSQIQASKRVYDGASSNFTGSTFPINGLDDLLTFDAPGPSAMTGHSVCKVCFEAFPTWEMLQTHYVMIHKLIVESHVN